MSTPKQEFTFTQDWTGLTCTVIASGPSLTKEDCEYARMKSDRVIVVNESWRMCPDADVLYAADQEWWETRSPHRSQFRGERWSINLAKSEKLEGVILAPGTFDSRFNMEGPIATGMNSGYQSLQLAIRRGCRKIVLLGFDMGRQGQAVHWHGDHGGYLKNPSDTLLTHCAAIMKANAPLMLEKGVEVLNASRWSALDCFPVVSLEGAY